MLSLLKIKNIALIDEIAIEFARGLNLLTGETGSGKSIIVDSLGALTGERISSDLIKEGETTAQIEGLFNVLNSALVRETLAEGGIEVDNTEEVDIIVRRELAAGGRNRIFVNNQLATQVFLKKLARFSSIFTGRASRQRFLTRRLIWKCSTNLRIYRTSVKI
ncbi:MAG: AAA family ATPase [Pyrinomonadaceae bacterium]